MPIFFQHQINESTRLGVWKIEETEEFFKGKVPQHRDVTHPHKRLQHLAGRFLLQYLFADFPYNLIQIADTRKPYLPEAQYHFSISHCGDYAAAIVSRNSRVGIDVEIPVSKIERIKHKFINKNEEEAFKINELIISDSRLLTLLWSAKESVFKWYGEGGVDFRKHIQIINIDGQTNTMDCYFYKDESELLINYRLLDGVVLAWVVS